tara:strand:+ start:19981 stop:21378 length:1398 start_codon:yes stop_codon:yes gene_type:complete
MRDIDPHDASIGLLSAILLAPQSIGAAETKLTASDFNNPTHGELFSLLVDMHHACESICDTALVISRLRDSGLLKRLGGPNLFKTTFLNESAPQNAEHYARHVRRFAVRRQLQELATEFSSRAKDEDPKDVGEWMRFELAAIESKASEHNNVSGLGEACTGLLREIHETRIHGKSPGLLTGIGPFDDSYGGLLPNRLYVVAARPGIGKSSISQQFGENIAAANHAALFVSLEMSSHEIAARYLAKRTGINGKFLTSHTIMDSEIGAIEMAVEEAMAIPFFISEPTGRRSTIEAICADARVQKSTRNISVLLVDYLQIVEPSDPRQSEYDKVTMATRAFKQLSRELKIPVVLLSQLSRKGEDGPEPRRPRLSDLRSSGSIEQDADAVVLLHDEGGGDISMIVAKMRGGERSETKLRFDGPTCQFSSPPVEDSTRYGSDFADQHVDRPANARWEDTGFLRSQDHDPF